MNSQNTKKRITQNGTCNLTLRFERDNSTEQYPCGNYTVEVSPSEVTVMVERDYEQRLQATDTPSQVERRDPNSILELEVGRVEYNNAKKYLRHTAYRSVSAREDDEELSIIDATASPAAYATVDEWDTNLLFKDILASLNPIDRTIIIGRLQGYGQSEIARRVGISQPAVNKRLKKLHELFQENLA